MKFTWTQRLVIRLIAWCLRRQPDSAPELRAGLDQAFRRRSEDQRIAMWRAALERNGIRVG